jgi:hypothetical protein
VRTEPQALFLGIGLNEGNLLLAAAGESFKNFDKFL